MTALVAVTALGDPEPAHNIDAFRAARQWAADHGHQQPDDRMLKAYGRVLLAANQAGYTALDKLTTSTEETP